MLDVLKNVGSVPIAEYAFDPGFCGREPTETERKRAASFRIPGWAVVPDGDVDRVRHEIAVGRPVIFSMPVGEAFAQHKGDGVFDTVEPAVGSYGHAMVAIGYDDKFSAFRIQNSYGIGWGDGGLAWLSYKVWRERVRGGYVILDKAPTPAPATVQPALATLLSGAPPMSAKLRASLEAELPRYAHEPGNKAFALALPDGGTFWTSTWGRAEDARQSLLERCQVAYNQPCTLLAENDTLRAPIPGQEWRPFDMPRARYVGNYNFEQIPGLRPEGRTAGLAEYAGVSGPKAVAWHGDGYASAAVGLPSQWAAEVEALGRCNAEADKRKRSPRCLLYAVGNTVVMPQRRTGPITAKP